MFFAKYLHMVKVPCESGALQLAVLLFMVALGDEHKGVPLIQHWQCLEDAVQQVQVGGSYAIGAGKKVGIGMDCDGNLATKTTSVLDEVRKLPPEAAALLKK